MSTLVHTPPSGLRFFPVYILFLDADSTISLLILSRSRNHLSVLYPESETRRLISILRAKNSWLRMVLYISFRGHCAHIWFVRLLGPSGAGKSSVTKKNMLSKRNGIDWPYKFIAHATGQNVGIGHLLTACTRSIDTYEKRLSDGRKVIFVDTPGYDLGNKNPNRVLNMLTQWLKTQSAK